MTIQELTAQQKDYVIETRRWLHAHPELGCEEIETTKFICAELEKIGVEVQTFEGITGCVGTIHGAKPGKTVMLRADIDALPMQEKNQVPYASVNPGVMHSCGHDCHTAMLLGAARMLMQKRDELCGTVKLIFQMAEEIGRKSEEYVKRGALDNINAIFGMHVWVHLPVGKCNFEAGPRMACSDRFTIQIHGEASHGSTPFLGKDAMVAAASAVMAIQGIVSRINDPRNPLVLTVGAMNGGQRMNILADHVEIVGTCRAFDREQRRQIARLFDGRAGGHADARAHLVGDDARERRLAEARRTVEQHVVERLIAPARGLDVDGQIALGLLLAGIVGQQLRAQADLALVLRRQARGDDGRVVLL